MSGIRTLRVIKTSLQFSPENHYLSSSIESPTENYQRSMSFPSRSNLKRFSIQSVFAETTLPRINNTNNNIRKSPLNLYEILRVKQNASTVEIKTAYRSLAKRIHPDAATSESDSRDFMEIHKAYITLSDPTARAHYDVSIGGISRRCGKGYYEGSSLGFVAGQMRRWETDQCW